jgi:small subunit ribosomal protein S2
MSIVSMKSLLESGVHFGHRTHKWNPAMKPYIFTERNGIHIIDLQKTVKALDEGYNLVRDIVADGGTVLFVGTKRQAQDTIRDEAERVEMPYVTTRWLGGMLTNWRTIRQRVNELERLERMRDQGEFTRITKKEALILQRKMDRLEYLLGGIRKMIALPDLVFVVDVYREATAIHEANLLEIPVLALVDTNCNPRSIDYVIPSNDDAIRAIKLLVGKVADAVLEGKALRKEEEVESYPKEAVMAISEEPELSDEELLGEATLAKLPSMQTSIESESEEEVIEVIVDESAEMLAEAEIESETTIEEEIVIEEDTEAVNEAESTAPDEDQEPDQNAIVEEEQAE